MNNDLKTKSKLLLTGVMSLGSFAALAQDNISARCHGYRYDSDCVVDTVPSAESEVTGLSNAQLKDAQKLAVELNGVGIVTDADMVLDRAVRIPERYNLPDPLSVTAAGQKNTARLEKLRKLVQAAKEIK